jgi:hypothetical protein
MEKPDSAIQSDNLENILLAILISERPYLRLEI